MHHYTRTLFKNVYSCKKTLQKLRSKDAKISIAQSVIHLPTQMLFGYRLRFLSPRKLLYRNMTVVDAKPPQRYRTISSWCIHGKSSSHRLKSDRMSNSRDARSACCSMLRIPLNSQWDSPAPRLGVTMSNQILTISSTIATG